MSNHLRAVFVLLASCLFAGSAVAVKYDEGLDEDIAWRDFTKDIVDYASSLQKSG